MAITVLSTPQAYTPAYNGQWFRASSTQTAQPNFTYTVIVTDLITSEDHTYEIEPRPDGTVVVDASVWSKNFIKDFVPNNQYGWQKCTDAVRKIRVNIGETYGSTPVYASGANNDYIIWNGYVRYLDWPSYNDSDYVYDAVTSNVKYLTPLFTKQTYTDKSLFLYGINSNLYDMGSVRITPYDESGNSLGESNIANPYLLSVDYLEKYLSIDIGRKGLDNIASGLVTGTYPILPANTAYYTIYDVSDLGAPPATVETFLMRVDVICETRHDVYCVQFKDKNGNFETILFPKVSEINIDAEKKYFRQNEYEVIDSEWTYDTFTGNEVMYNSNAKKRIRLTTDWLSDDQINNYQNVINGVAYLDYGSTIGLVPIKVMTNSYRINKKWNEKMWSLTIDIEFSFKELYA